MPDQADTRVEVGFAPEEIRIDEPTRAARLKWVVIVDADLPPGRAINAAVCVAAAIGAAVPGLLGPDGKDASGEVHPGLPWAGCTVLAAESAELRALRDRAAAGEGTLVVDMPSQAQHTRVYGEYLDTLARAGQHRMSYYALGIIGPRNRVDKLVEKFPLA
ncbi:DUF2000 domain-containing protein [Nocardia sp. NPDC052112]|uniref:DUF2000 domain-containing protein n=1 Tax=Nocardia sp. NPDC052112 TaxID=3155646 RepID=UPI003422B381